MVKIYRQWMCTELSQLQSESVTIRQKMQCMGGGVDIEE